ncbi:aminotransferase class I/II-fold pyridoxal phosphate-dependent enzyme [Bacillus songklensis]|uniref:Aminotransferase class I/II-fold pyridoxal phosphate-dependent enzyme n=1 Tax=Bacillus songklensis TaxID=1069116 RepID=A0ABV8AYY0_9BACI
MDQSYTPLFTQLQEHYLKRTLSFHVPGHKNGKIFPDLPYSLFSSILNIDATELSGLDDLHNPEGVIAQAQSLAADLYGVDTTYFLINGSTVGNLASILSVAEANDVMIVQRDCHKSVLNALKLANILPVFIAPEYDISAHICTGVKEETVIKAINQYPWAKGIVLTNPNYYGLTRNLKGIVEHAHNYNIPVIVDEAHGAHFILGDPFPQSAAEAGADLIVQSAHKTLPAMTMGSYLHVQGSLVNMEKLEFYLRALQSSSPSYPIMASLDLARYYLAQLKSDKSEIISLRAELEQFKQRLNEIEGLKVMPFSSPDIKEDLLKVMIQPDHRFIKTGYRLQKQLESYGIYSELADMFRVLFILPLGKNFPFEESIHKIREALRNIRDGEPHVSLDKIQSFSFQHTSLTISYQQMQTLKKEFVSFEEAIGRVAAEPVIPYPPGIPILVEGELITKDHISYIVHLKKLNANIQGGHAISNRQLKVFLI